MGHFIPLFVSSGDFVDTVASIVLAGVITVVVVVVLFVGKLLVLFGEFFPPLFLVTWIHLSTSFLLGCSSIFLMVGAVVFLSLSLWWVKS